MKDATVTADSRVTSLKLSHGLARWYRALARNRRKDLRNEIAGACRDSKLYELSSSAARLDELVDRCHYHAKSLIFDLRLQRFSC